MLRPDFHSVPLRHDEGIHITHIHGPVYGPVHTGAGHIYVGSAAEAITRPEFRRYLRLLAVVAAPVVGNTVDEPPPAPLDLWAEWRRLEDAIHGAWDEVRGKGAPWAVLRLNPPTRNALGDAIAAGNPDGAYQVVHFSGHGAPDGLAFEDELGRTDFISDDELVNLFRGSPVRLVVLNACQTVAIADRLVSEAGVPAVIATTDSLRDDEARLITERLYARLAREQCVGDALAEALAALKRAYLKSDLPIPPDRDADHDTYLAERLAVPNLRGDSDLRLVLPPEDERATEPFISLGEPPSNLRYDLLTGFVGRGRELVELAEWLCNRPSPVVVISGLGGLGKSALALMTTMRQNHCFRAVVTLSAKDNPADCNPDALVAALDSVLEMGGALSAAPTAFQRQQAALALLNESAVLLLLDNLESLDEAQTRAWADFLAGLDPRRGSTALLTLRPAAKHPLTDLAGPTHLRLERLAEPDAVRLLAEGLTIRSLWHKVEPLTQLDHHQQQRLTALARRAHLKWVPLDHLAALDDWAERAGRHPYQMRLALGALTYAHNTWAGVRRRLHDLRGRDWEQHAEMLVGAMLNDLAANAPGAVKLLQAMLVFRGGASYEALRAVAGTDGEDDVVFDDRLAAAIDSNLLEAGVRQARYDLHPLTSAYLETHRPPDPTRLMAYRRRHAAHFLAYARKHRWDFGDLEAELPNLRVGFEFATNKETRDEAMVRDYGGALFEMFQTRGHWDDVLTWVAEAAKANEALGDQASLSNCYTNIAGVHWDRGNYREALEWLEKTAALDEKRGDKAALGSTYNAMGVIYSDLGKMGQAVDWLDRSLALREEANDRRGLATTWANIGMIHYARGEYDQALSYYERAAPVLEEIGDRAMLATVFNNIGVIHYSRGDYDQAMSYYERAAPVLEEIGDRAMLATVLNNIGEVYRARGDYDQAMSYFERAAPVLEEIGDRAVLAKVLNNIGGIYYARSDYDQAMSYYERAAPVLEEIGDRAMLATVQVNLGALYLQFDNEAKAETCLHHAIALYGELGLRQKIGEVQAVLRMKDVLGTKLLAKLLAVSQTPTGEQALEHFLHGLPKTVSAEDSADKAVERLKEWLSNL